MVSLFDMSTQALRWAHLDTGLPSLNLLLDIKMDAVLDVQSVPAHAAVWAVLANVVVSHLAEPGTSVALIETLNAFEWEWLEAHPGYQQSWHAERPIRVYRLDTFAKLFLFFSATLLHGATDKALLVLACNFHETVELYRLQLAACHEEILVKHQIDITAVLWANRAKGAEEGYDLIDLPKLPKGSLLLRESPAARFKKHLNMLLLVINSFAYRQSAVVFLQGYMEPRYKPYTYKSSAAASQTASTASEGPAPNGFFSKQPASRLVLVPVTFSKENDDHLGENRLSSRLIFYNDWYFRSPHFRSERRPRDRSDCHFVSVVKVTNFHGVHSINKPIYFDFLKNPFSRLGPTGPWFINLLAAPVSPTCPIGDLDPADLSSALRKSVHALQQSTQALQPSTKSSQAHENARPLSSVDAVSGTPNGNRKRSLTEAELAPFLPVTTSQLDRPDYPEEDGSECSNAQSVEVDIEACSFDQLVIEGSDVELTGTVFDDLSGFSSQSSAGWMTRHM